MTDDEWISTRQAADILGVSESTVYRSLNDPAEADRQWGSGNWRVKPVARRRIYQVSRKRVEQLATSNTS